MIATILDTETTGLIDNGTLPLDKQPEIIELYMREVDLSSVSDVPPPEVNQLFKPSKPVSEEITRITHIDNDMLKDAPSFKDHAIEIKDFIEASELIIAHNASFDKEMLDLEFKRLGITLKWPRIICTVEATIYMKGFRLNLQGLHEMLFGVPFKEAHRAKTDVAALHRCCVELFKMGVL